MAGQQTQTCFIVIIPSQVQYARAGSKVPLRRFSDQDLSFPTVNKASLLEPRFAAWHF
jgi:hypothetical protein